MRIEVMYFFFFSSRRRHTRYWRDWSSDVCSSDLEKLQYLKIMKSERRFLGVEMGVELAHDGCGKRSVVAYGQAEGGVLGENEYLRSEERRVGKECRSRWSPYH